MDSISSVQNTVKRNWNGMFSDNKNILILILAILLILSVIGVGFFHILIDGLQVIIDRLMIAFDKLISGVFYSTGEILVVSSNTVADAAKTTINLGSGAINDVGNLLKSASSHEPIPPVKLNQPIPPIFRRRETTKPTKHSKSEEEGDEGESEEEEGFLPKPKSMNQLIQQGTPMPSAINEPHPVGSYSSNLSNITSFFS